ncbi:putative SnoaL-like aldol condensation-catalyzing enzyme [Sphingobium sp. B1D7B]|uniref:nuclear transport factor 2 family protein n=1 Tax=Sphingobium sp. B1D7B TaxID=2940578 RepID=UPI0022253783|nr:nuclear transport factor 2 family protein [Sphingobium sp. B1D7B]MCW2403635.1 putative SnoaL-like aldol condensation-catalyzing enzyme [Sphingobium sp. B1D7B]
MRVFARNPAIAALLVAMTMVTSPGHAQVAASAEAQQAMLASPDPKLAANKKLVYDMYRHIVQGGHADLVERFFTPEYIQHNPNVASGRDALAAFLRGSRPARPISPTITLPIIRIVAEGDYVLVMSERPMKDEAGKPYATSWFDVYRIENGLIAEHWDPALKSAAMLKFDPNEMGK